MTGGCSECVPGCTCGFGGEHVDDNPRCRANWEATAIAAVDLIEGRRVVTGEAGPVLDDVRQAMRYAAYGVTWGVPMSQIDRAVDAVLSVPAVAEVFARDAKVREIVKEWDTTPTHDTHHMGSFKAMDLAARLDSPLNQNATFTAAQVAAMLREAGE